MNNNQIKNHILVCGGTGCKASQSEEIIESLRHAIEHNGLEQEIQVVRTGCFGFCEKGPIVKIIPDNTFYVHVKPDDAEEIVAEHLVKGRTVNRLLYVDPETKQTVSDSKHMGFYRKQLRIALRNCGFINPENIHEYIARDGYAALGLALSEMTPETVIQTIIDSGLRGRGGGGFPTGLKWDITRKVQAAQKYVVCNADEGDPGAFMDRSILEGDPHTVLEAIAINGYCTGASKGLIYIRAEYPLAIQRLKIAIAQAREMGLDDSVLDATLLIAWCDGATIHIHLYGDGCIAVQRADGGVATIQVEYAENTPYYLSYLLHPQRGLLYQEAIGDPATAQSVRYQSDAGETTRREHFDAPTVFSFDLAAFPTVAVATDGLDSFVDAKTGQRLNLLAVAREMLDFRNLDGAFIQRRLRETLIEYAQRQVFCCDDIGVGAFIALDEETAMDSLPMSIRES